MVEPSFQRCKIILLVPVLNFGGVETRILIQAAKMKGRVKDLRVCTFWKPGAKANSLKKIGVQVDVLGINPSIRSFKATVRLLKYLRSHKPDILHCCIGEANWHGVIAGTLARVPIRIVEEVGIPSRSVLTRILFPWVYRFAHRVIGVSRATCGFLIEEDKVSPKKIRKVYNPVEDKFFECLNSESEKGHNVFRIVTIGRLVPIKNHPILIRAFFHLRRRFPDAVLEIIGEGPSRIELEKLIHSLELGDSVRLLGFQDDVRPFLANADLFVLPSHSEGFGITLVEALSCEVPVLSSNIGGASEIIRDLGPEFLLSPYKQKDWMEAMVKFVEMTPEKRKAIGLRGRKLVLRRFSAQNYTRNLESIYEGLMK